MPACAVLTISRARTATLRSRFPPLGKDHRSAMGVVFVNAMHAWLASASGSFGTPARFKYAGLAQMIERTWPTRRTRSAESGSAPIRTPRSMPSSASETTRSSRVSRRASWGWASRNSDTTGTR